MTNPPSTPQSTKREHLGFTRQPMVRWFDPGLLVGTGIRALLSSIFGAYADKREIQAVLQHHQQIHD
ncbi:hypothetical protein HYR99_15150 [Candidatus Poribacteria bacterium]|nr:hypothetical protein [Candidatus Poribacteria bacterium]